MITLVLGGARSGKSGVAEELAGASGASVAYLATARLNDEDHDLARRVAMHRLRRPAHWTTIECGDDLVGALTRVSGAAIIDSLGVWLAALPSMQCDATALCDFLGTYKGDVVVVSDEVGLGVHPSSEAGRKFRDALGTLNQAVAQVADTVLLVVAGQVLRVKPANP